MVTGDVNSMGRIVLGLWWLLSYCPLVAEVDHVLVSRAWLTVEELMECAEQQSGEPHHLDAVDHLRQMVLYDHLTNAKDVRAAVLEYYTYVLGERVLWQREDGAWRLIEDEAVEAPSSWIEKKDEQVITPLFFREVSFPFAVHQPSLPGYVWLPLDEEDQQIADQKNVDSHVVVPRVSGLVDESRVPEVDAHPHEEEVFWRRASRRQSSGALPLSTLMLKGGESFSMCPSEDESEALLAAYESKIMRDTDAMMGSMIADIDVLAQGEVKPILVRGQIFECGIGPTYGSLDLDGGLEAIRCDEDQFSGPRVPGAVQQEMSSSSNTGKRWLRLKVPKHILSFSPKRLVARLKEMRLDHPQEQEIPKPSRRVSLRRKQAQSLFDEVSDWVADKRLHQQARRVR
jgi:hypothetical protein